ncbi:hypothetical protein EUGRSUZ_D00212 [Eucalyptus grandis]|uniref:Uncharacterized protein n=2 Tax=Eucalyptus grandis TaxID=71139 RepID=A0ACC3L2E5_EUCGR|nr:hypothetical protein EUGRSUZ_D00212 [Eucalyptus grandis]
MGARFGVKKVGSGGEGLSRKESRPQGERSEESQPIRRRWTRPEQIAKKAHPCRTSAASLPPDAAPESIPAVLPSPPCQVGTLPAACFFFPFSSRSASLRLGFPGAAIAAAREDRERRSRRRHPFVSLPPPVPTICCCCLAVAPAGVSYGRLAACGRGSPCHGQPRRR